MTPVRTAPTRHHHGCVVPSGRSPHRPWSGMLPWPRWVEVRDQDLHPIRGRFGEGVAKFGGGVRPGGDGEDAVVLDHWQPTSGAVRCVVDRDRSRPVERDRESGTHGDELIVGVEPFGCQVDQRPGVLLHPAGKVGVARVGERGDHGGNEPHQDHPLQPRFGDHAVDHQGDCDGDAAVEVRIASSRSRAGCRGTTAIRRR